MSYSILSSILLGGVCLLFLGSCTPEPQETIYNDAAIADESQTANWLAYGRTHNERRFFPASDINAGTLTCLMMLVWYPRPLSSMG